VLEKHLTKRLRIKIKLGYRTLKIGTRESSDPSHDKTPWSKELFSKLPTSLGNSRQGPCTIKSLTAVKGSESTIIKEFFFPGQIKFITEDCFVHHINNTTQ
jgi:hypothetical protein